MKPTFRYFELLRTTFALLIPCGVPEITRRVAAIDAIFFVTVASQHKIALSDCHVAFWTFGAYMDPCRHGCSAVGGARVGLNTFETCKAVVDAGS